jgi:DNA invertase Pin-like site-specific DNA recombinase
MDFVRRGERHNQAKMTEEQVREIRRLRADGMKLASIARRFGITTGTASDIANRKTWRHLP